jgi:hypothetical protein
VHEVVPQLPTTDGGSATPVVVEIDKCCGPPPQEY